MWVLTNDGMALVEPRERAVVHLVPVDGPCGAPTSGVGALWAASRAAGTVLRIDAERGAVLATIPAHLVEYESSLSTAGAVWLITDTASTLTRIDAATNRVVAQIAVKPGSTGVAAGFGAVWATNTGVSAGWARLRAARGPTHQSRDGHDHSRAAAALSA